MDLHPIRRSFEGARLLECQAPNAPWPLFRDWLQAALEANLPDATAMALATATADGRPSARTVLLKAWSEEGLVFFTRYSTQKGSELLDNPRAAVLFFWAQPSRQVRAEGRVKRVSRETSAAYFDTRPSDSKAAARAASGCVGAIEEAALRRRFDSERKRIDDTDVPPEMPDDWGGYCLEVERWEFWQGQPGRLHDRLVYESEAANRTAWHRFRLAP